MRKVPHNATVALSAALLLVGCGVASTQSQAQSATAPTTTSTTVAPTTTTSPEAYRVSAGDVSVAIKQAAVDAVLALTNYDESDTPAVAAQQRLTAKGIDGALAAQAPQLLRKSSDSRGTIVYPQLGGLGPDNASVMVVVDQDLDGDDHDAVRTIDVRVRRSGSVWKAVAIASDGGEKVKRPKKLGAEQAAVLDSDAIELPDSARWDIHAGRVDSRILRQLLDLSRDHRVSVAVLATGHPTEVYGKAQLSNHTHGRGVDIWAIDDVPVVDQRNEKMKALLQRLAATDLPELGGPFDVDGRGTRTFTDALHQDHLHLAYEG